MKPPRRRVVVNLKIGTDDWQEIRHALRTIETEIALYGELSRNSVSGGVSSGWILTSDEDKTITHETYAAENLGYVQWLRRNP